jgi:hypothetical protein
VGYQARTYKLVWPEGHTFHGLEIRMRGMSLAELDSLAKFERPEGDATVASRAAEMHAMTELFSARLISWNLEDENGAPVGTDVDSVAAADLGVVMSAIGAWQREVTRVPDPLPQSSSDGQRFQVAPIPTIQDLPSPNLQSLPMPG